MEIGMMPFRLGQKTHLPILQDLFRWLLDDLDVFLDDFLVIHRDFGIGDSLGWVGKTNLSAENSGFKKVKCPQPLSVSMFIY